MGHIWPPLGYSFSWSIAPVLSYPLYGARVKETLVLWHASEAFLVLTHCSRSPQHLLPCLATRLL